MEADFTTIRIDIDIFKLIQTNLTSFTETPNDVLRRLLGIEKMGPIKKHILAETISERNKGITVKGVFFKEGTELRGFCNGLNYIVTIRNGNFHYNGKLYNYPSAVGNDITGTATDGWRFLHYLNPQTGKWEPIKNLRPSITNRKRKGTD